MPATKNVSTQAEQTQEYLTQFSGWISYLRGEIEKTEAQIAKYSAKTVPVDAQSTTKEEKGADSDKPAQDKKDTKARPVAAAKKDKPKAEPTEDKVVDSSLVTDDPVKEEEFLSREDLSQGENDQPVSSMDEIPWDKQDELSSTEASWDKPIDQPSADDDPWAETPSMDIPWDKSVDLPSSEDVSSTETSLLDTLPWDKQDEQPSTNTSWDKPDEPSAEPNVASDNW